MCTPSAPKAPTTPKADPLRVLLSRDRFDKKSGGYRLPARTVTSDTGGAGGGFSLPSYNPGLNTGV